MRNGLARRIVSLVALSVALEAQPLPGTSPESPANRLTPAERAAGWRLLFDGTNTSGWRGFKKPAFPDKGWIIEEGCLKHERRGGGGNIITDRTFNDFEFSFEWRLSPRANSGVKYFITERRAGPIGHEYQIIDDKAHGFARPGRKQQTAGFYDVLAPTAWQEPRPPGQFNHSRIVVQGSNVQHWLNGLKTLEYELGSPQVLEAVAASKFKEIEGFGVQLEGHLLLQDHGGEVWFRNLKLRELPAQGPVSPVTTSRGSAAQ